MNLKHFNFKQIKLDQIESTNSYLTTLNNEVKQGCGTVVRTDFQTDGIGQRGNSWIVEPFKNLTFSVVVYPNIDAKYAFYLNIVASLAVQKTLIDLKIISKIKWPNDILVKHKKISGILIENQVNGQKITQSIIGIGLNVNQKAFKNMNATSILNEGVTINIDDVLKQIYGYLDFYYNILIESNYKLLLKLYYSHLFLMDDWGVFEVEGNQFKAKVLGVNEHGFLSIMTEDNHQKYFDLKEIKFIF